MRDLKIKGLKRETQRNKRLRAPKGSTAQNIKYLQANKGQARVSHK